MNRVQAGGLVLLVLLVAIPLVGTAGGATATGSQPADTVVEADFVEFRITVFENASARWSFTYTRVLDNETERERFRGFATEFNRNETDAFRQFRRQAEALALAGRNATGREMAVADFSRQAELGGDCLATQDCGTIRMSFTWRAFARSDGDRLVVGDVFGTGLFLSSNQELVFEAGPGLAFDAAAPDTYNSSDVPLAQRESITYQGEQSFPDRRPRAVFVPDEQPGGNATVSPRTTAGQTTAATPGDGATGTDERGGGFPMALVGGLFIVLVGAGAAFTWWRRGGAPTVTGGPPGDAGGAAAERPAEAEPAVPEEELLTDEDRVLKLLQENGGRMKQVAIVEETGWSKSKVSMLLSDMEGDDQISKLRVGRENIISIAGHEPEAAGSPHEED